MFEHICLYLQSSDRRQIKFGENHNAISSRLLAPLWNDVFKYMRDKHGLHSNIQDYNFGEKYYFDISDYSKNISAAEMKKMLLYNECQSNEEAQYKVLKHMCYIILNNINKSRNEE